MITQPQPLMRRMCGWGFATTVRYVFDTPFKDTQCGAKAFRRTAARYLAQVVSETRWTFDLDLLLSAKRLGLKVHKQPVVWADRVGSQLRYGSTTSEVLRALWAMRLGSPSLSWSSPSYPLHYRPWRENRLEPRRQSRSVDGYPSCTAFDPEVFSLDLKPSQTYGVVYSTMSCGSGFVLSKEDMTT